MTSRQMRKTWSGNVCEMELYPLPTGARRRSLSNPEPDNVRTPEQKERYNLYKSRKQFERVVNTNFSPADWYVTLTYDSENLPESYENALKDIENFKRRIKYAFPNVRIISVTGYGNTGRLHHHLLIGSVGLTTEGIIDRWHCGLTFIEHLREHNFYDGENGLEDRGADYTALADYLHKHALPEHKGKRWSGTKNLIQPKIERKKVKTPYTVNHPPKAPEGFRLVEARGCDFYKSDYVYFKYVREVRQPVELRPNFTRSVYARL